MSALVVQAILFLSVQFISLKRSETIIHTLAILFYSLAFEVNALFVCVLNFVGKDDRDTSGTDS